MIRKYKMQVPQENPAAAQTDPPDALTALLADLKEKDFDQLAAFAKEQSIDLGQTTSAGGAYKKIADYLTKQAAAGNPDQ